MAKFKLEDGTEIEAFTAEDLEREVAGLKAKRDELLGLHAKDKERLAELEQAQKEAEEARQREKGEFKTLYETTQAELRAERERAAQFRQQVEDKEKTLSAASLVAELTRDTKRAALLQKEALAFAKHGEQGVTYEIGGVEVDAAKVKAHLSEAYPFLVDGDRLSGGGALGGNRNSQGLKKWSEMTESERLQLKRDDPEAFYNHLRGK